MPTDETPAKREPLTKMLCPCGGPAWSLAELLALCSTEDERDGWRSILGPGDHYCSWDDDVLIRGTEEDRLG